MLSNSAGRGDEAAESPHAPVLSPRPCSVPGTAWGPLVPDDLERGERPVEQSPPRGRRAGRDTARGQLRDTGRPFCGALGTDRTARALGWHIERASSAVGQKAFPKDAVPAGERPSAAGTPGIDLRWFSSQAQLGPYKWSVGLSRVCGLQTKKRKK